MQFGDKNIRTIVVIEDTMPPHKGIVRLILQKRLDRSLLNLLSADGFEKYTHKTAGEFIELENPEIGLRVLLANTVTHEMIDQLRTPHHPNYLDENCVLLLDQQLVDNKRPDGIDDGTYIYRMLKESADGSSVPGQIISISDQPLLASLTKKTLPKNLNKTELSTVLNAEPGTKDAYKGVKLLVSEKSVRAVSPTTFEFSLPGSTVLTTSGAPTPTIATSPASGKPPLRRTPTIATASASGRQLLRRTPTIGMASALEKPPQSIPTVATASSSGTPTLLRGTKQRSLSNDGSRPGRTNISSTNLFSKTPPPHRGLVVVPPTVALSGADVKIPDGKISPDSASRRPDASPQAAPGGATPSTSPLPTPSPRGKQSPGHRAESTRTVTASAMQGSFFRPIERADVSPEIPGRDSAPSEHSFWFKLAQYRNSDNSNDRSRSSLMGSLVGSIIGRTQRTAPDETPRSQSVITAKKGMSVKIVPYDPTIATTFSKSP